MLAAAIDGPWKLLKFTDFSELTLQHFGLSIGIVGLLIYLLAIVSVALTATNIGRRKEEESSMALWLIGLGCGMLLLGAFGTYGSAVGSLNIIRLVQNPSPAELRAGANSAAIPMIIGCVGFALNMLLSIVTILTQRQPAGSDV